MAQVTPDTRTCIIQRLEKNNLEASPADSFPALKLGMEWMEFKIVDE
jgi:hypothetical protein